MSDGVLMESLSWSSNSRAQLTPGLGDPKNVPLMPKLVSVSATCNQVLHNTVYLFLSTAYSQPKAKTVHDPEISSFDFSEACGIAVKLTDLMASFFKARMYPGLLRTAVVDACCPRVTIASAPFQYYKGLTWLINHIFTLFISVIPFLKPFLTPQP